MSSESESVKSTQATANADRKALTSDAPAPIVALADWGTTNLRIWAIDASGTIRASTRARKETLGKGAEQFQIDLAHEFTAMGIDGLDIPVLICGMAGAKGGWREAPYVTIPAGFDELAAKAVKVEGAGVAGRINADDDSGAGSKAATAASDTPANADRVRDIRIVPGMAQKSEDAPDVMRGEETILCGLVGGQVRGDATICLPGTHSKWAHIQDGRVTAFNTMMTGELFDLLANASILCTTLDASEASDDAFVTAVTDAHAKPALAMERLFRLRAGPLLFGADKFKGGYDYLSGLLIGAEIANGMERLEGSMQRPSPHLAFPTAASRRSRPYAPVSNPSPARYGQASIWHRPPNDEVPQLREYRHLKAPT